MAAAIPVAIAVAAAASIYQGVEANQQRQDAKGAANKADDERKKVEETAKNASESANNLSTSNALRDAAKQRQQAVIGNNMGRGSTILTGGLGLTQPATTASKTVLGQ